MGYKMEKRNYDLIEVDPEDVLPGDVFGITRLDGLDPLMMYATGGSINKCAIAIEFNK